MIKTTTIACGVIVAVAGLLSGWGTTTSQARKPIHGKLVLTPSEVVAALASAPTFEPFGFTAHNSSTIDEQYADWARMELKIGERLKVISVEQGSLASKAGLRQGDIIVSIDGTHVQRGQQGIDTLVNEIIPEIDWSHPVRILVIRDGGAIELEFPATADSGALALL